MKGIPIMFLVVLLATVMLTIFLGAWAVSADRDEQARQLSFGVAGSGSNRGVRPLDASQTTSQRDSSDQERARSKADTWWGNALIKACPLH